MSKANFIRLLSFLTFVIALTQKSCGEHLCMRAFPVMLTAVTSSTFNFWALGYLLGTFGHIYVIIRPDSKAAVFVYGCCFLFLLIPAISYYFYWLEYHKWISSNIFWWFHIPFLILGFANLYTLFSRPVFRNKEQDPVSSRLQ